MSTPQTHRVYDSEGRLLDEYTLPDEPRLCEHCGESPGVRMPDPYIAEVHGYVCEVFLCYECANERRMEI